MNSRRMEPVTLRALQVFSIAITIGPLIFIAVAIVVNEMSPVEPAFSKTLSLAISSAVFVLAIAAAHFSFKKKIDSLKNSTANTQEKLSQYRNALVGYMALAEAPAILSGILFFLTGNYWILIFVAMSMAAMFQKFPSRQRVIADVGLDWREQDDFK